MKINKNIALLLLTACMLAGCGKQADLKTDAGMKLIKEGSYQEALEQFDAALLEKEDKELIYRGQGIAYMGLYDYQSAVDSFLNAFQYANGDVTSLQFDTNYYLAASYYKLGQYDKAQEIYSAILSLNNKEKNAYYLRGCTYLKLGNFDAALADFKKSFSLSDRAIDMMLDAYQEMEQAGFKEQGQAFLQEYLTKNETTLESDKKGMIYYYLEDYANARNYLDGALTTGNAEVSLILGKAYEKLGTIDYAIVVYQNYLNDGEPNAAIYDSLGTCLMKQEKYEEALQAFTAGVDMGDSAYLQSLRFHVIVANEYLGNFSQAKNLMQDYLTIYPNDKTAIKENEFLQSR